MIEPTSSSSDSHAPESEQGGTAEEIRQRAERLRQKVGELSTSFDHIEQSLAQAAGDSESAGPG